MLHNTESSMAFDDMVIKGVRTLHNEIIIILFIKLSYYQPRGMLIKNGFASGAYVERKVYFVKRRVKKVAGAVGFEPTNAGSKSRCLTERRMKNGGLLGFIFLEF